MTGRLLVVALALLALSVFMTERAGQSIFSGDKVTVPVDELMRLNPD